MPHHQRPDASGPPVVPGVEAAEHLVAAVLEPALLQRRTDVVDQPDGEPLVVDRRQCGRQHLLGLEQVVQVGARVVRAGVAVARGVDRAEIAPVLGPGDVEPAVARVEGGVARDPGGLDAVEGVGPVLDRGEEVVRLGDAEQVPRLVGRQLVADPADDGAQVRLLQRPTDAEPVESAPVDRHLGQAAGGGPAQVLVLGALDHPEQRLVRPADPLLGQPSMLDQATPGPAPGALDRLHLVRPGVHQRRQLVEGEHDVGAQLVLDPHRHLGGEAELIAVEVGEEGHPVLVDERPPRLALGDHVVVLQAGGVHRQDLLEPGTEAHHLEAPGIGEGRPRPVHEGAESTGLVDDVGARLQIQVVRVRQHRLGTELLDLAGRDRLHRGLGTDRHERRGPDLPVRGADHPRTPPPVVQLDLATETERRRTSRRARPAASPPGGLFRDALPNVVSPDGPWGGLRRALPRDVGDWTGGLTGQGSSR
ncbi:hypothetical protein SDC9_93738 [bioreactor metagenome]|uniref:Uncharacterized protein n=1 Tax=bioreactor metagenome TaxID=1076179 RepID=A0A645A1F5_9ZZZZ